MQEDRFFTALGSLVDRVLNDRTRPDFRALYYAKIISWQAGGGPSGNVDVQFEDTFATGGPGSFRLGSANGVAILPSIGGLSYRPQPGTRVLVGWQGGDERYPYVAGWVSNGGSQETVIAATRVELGTATDSLLDKVATKQDVQDAINSIVSAFNGHTHAAGSLVAGMVAVTGATAGAASIGGSTTIDGSPSVFAEKP